MKVVKPASFELNAVVKPCEKTWICSVLKNDVVAVLHSYFNYCALQMSCLDLVRAFSFLANEGVSAHSGEQILTVRQTKQVNWIMATSGLYDEAGNFAYGVVGIVE